MKNIFPYLAGYIDGDGCLYLGTFSQGEITVYEFSLQIASVKKAVLNEFKTNFGGSIRMRPYKQRHKDAFCWTIKGQCAEKTALGVLPYLVEKTKQCQLFIEFSKSIQCNNFKTVAKKTIDLRNELIKQIREEKHMNNHVTREEIEKLKEVALTITPVDLDYPYLAGLIDSEGCFRIKTWKPKKRPNHVYNITVEIGNTKFPVMPWLVKRFGGSVVYIEGRNGKKPSATWTLSAAALYKVLPKIRPYLSSKQEVCDKLLEFQQTILPNGGDRHSELFRALFEKRREIRESIIAEVHALNHKGSH